MFARYILGIAILSLLCTASATAAGPVFGNSAADGQSPIMVNDCQFYYRGNLLVGVADGVRIEYTNESHKTANLIAFLVKAGQHSVIIRDAGTFSPGVEIIHKFRKQTGAAVYSPLFSHPKVTCRAQDVHFVDGTTWRYGEVPTASSVTIKRLGLILKNTDGGVTIATIAPGGQGDLAGLKQNDVITSFGGNAVRTVQDIETVLSITQTGAKIPVLVLRNGETITLTVVL